MQPYQNAAEEIQRQGQVPIRALKKVGSIATNLGASFLGGAAISKIAPFLSQYIPKDLAIKGLSKIDPRFGSFINTALQNGKSFDEVKDFIAEKSGIANQEDESKNENNIISQVSPQLFQVLRDRKQKGKDIRNYVKQLKGEPFFKKDISDLEKMHKMDILDIVDQVFGGGTRALKPKKATSREEALANFRNKIMERQAQEQGQIQNQQPQQQQTDWNQIASQLQNILKM